MRHLAAGAQPTPTACRRRLCSRCGSVWRDIRCEHQPVDNRDESTITAAKLQRPQESRQTLAVVVLVVARARHGHRARSHRVRVLGFFAQGPHGSQVQRGAPGARRGQDRHVPGGGAAFVSHLARLRPGGVGG